MFKNILIRFYSSTVDALVTAHRELSLNNLLDRNFEIDLPRFLEVNIALHPYNIIKMGFLDNKRAREKTIFGMLMTHLVHTI